MDVGGALDRHLGKLQGGQLSPLLANVPLEEVYKDLEARGYSLARYTDDCKVYVGRLRASERVMAFLKKLYKGLKLQINEAKSAVASAFRHKFPGYALLTAKGDEVRCAVANMALDNAKARIGSAPATRLGVVLNNCRTSSRLERRWWDRKRLMRP